MKSFMSWTKKPKKKGVRPPPPKPSKPPASPPTTKGYSPKPEPTQKSPPPPPKHNSKVTKPKPLPPKQDPENEFIRIFKKLTYQHRPWDIWKDFVVMTACAFSNAVDKLCYNEREEMYMDAIKGYSKEELALFPELLAYTVMALEANPEQDFLGHIFMSLDLGNEAGGQFFTPYEVSQLMAKITLGDIQKEVKEKGYITIHDPCCGAGTMLIAGINSAREQLPNVNFQNHILVVGQDIDQTVALMCYIQISLLGVAGYVKVGNSLTEPMSPDDSLENYWFTPIYFSDVWFSRMIAKRMDHLFEKENENIC